jgi:hypothetical protein
VGGEEGVTSNVLIVTENFLWGKLTSNELTITLSMVKSNSNELIVRFFLGKVIKSEIIVIFSGPSNE